MARKMLGKLLGRVRRRVSTAPDINACRSEGDALLVAQGYADLVEAVCRQPPPSAHLFLWQGRIAVRLKGRRGFIGRAAAWPQDGRVVQLASEHLSRLHLEWIRIATDLQLLRDVGSTNGTARISEAGVQTVLSKEWVFLKEGDRLVFGRNEWLVGGSREDDDGSTISTTFGEQLPQRLSLVRDKSHEDTATAVTATMDQVHLGTLQGSLLVRLAIGKKEAYLAGHPEDDWVEREALLRDLYGGEADRAVLDNLVSACRQTLDALGFERPIESRAGLIRLSGSVAFRLDDLLRDDGLFEYLTDGPDVIVRWQGHALSDNR